MEKLFNFFLWLTWTFFQTVGINFENRYASLKVSEANAPSIHEWPPGRGSGWCSGHSGTAAPRGSAPSHPRLACRDHQLYIKGQSHGICFVFYFLLKMSYNRFEFDYFMAVLLKFVGYSTESILKGACHTTEESYLFKSGKTLWCLGHRWVYILRGACHTEEVTLLPAPEPFYLI